MSEYGDALARYKLENNLSCKDIERKVGVSSSQIGLIIGGSTSSEALKKKISDGLGGILEEYINYKECSVCSKPFVSNMKSSETCSVECSTKRNKERCKITKKETMADRLIEYRKNAGIDQKQLAELIGVTKVTVKNLENCEKYSDETAKKIFDALGNKFKKFLKPSVCQCGKVFYKRRDVMKFCSAECSKKYYKPDAEALAKYKATQNEAFKAVRGKRKAIMEKHSISSFMDGMQYGDRQKEYLLNLQKTQRMEIRL